MITQLWTPMSTWARNSNKLQAHLPYGVTYNHCISLLTRRQAAGDATTPGRQEAMLARKASRVTLTSTMHNCGLRWGTEDVVSLPELQSRILDSVPPQSKLPTRGSFAVL